MSKNPLATGIGIGAISSLLSSLMSGGSSGSSGGSSGTTGICTTQYYYSANPNPNDPCAIYSPNGTASGTSLPSSSTADCSLSDLIGQNCQSGYTAQSEGTDSNGCTVWQCVASGSTSSGSCPNVSVPACSTGYVLQDQGTDSSGCALAPICVFDTSAELSSSTTSTASSTSGQIPCGSGMCDATYYCSTVDPGQCIPNGSVDCGTYSCSMGDTCATDGTEQCIPPDTTGTGSNNVVPVADLISDPSLYINTPTTETPAQTALNQNPIPVPANGLHGDLLSFGGGATVYAQSISGTTEVSGFYGGSGAGSLCESRPWANNFLSYIIPPAFFDNLCTWAGHPTGTILSPAATQLGGTTQVVAGPGSPSLGAQSTQSDTTPAAQIGASPATVNIGGRTTVFWTSRNVTSCEESSSDGNFHGTTISGGASTVSLSGPVTFYITCLGLDGTQTSSSYTVNIGI